MKKLPSLPLFVRVQSLIKLYSSMKLSIKNLSFLLIISFQSFSKVSRNSSLKDVSDSFSIVKDERKIKSEASTK